MKKSKGISKAGKAEAQAESYVGGLIQILEALDFAEAQKAAQALGEAADAAAIKPLVSVVKDSAALRAAAMAALKKIGREDEAAAVELAIALMEETGADTVTETGVHPFPQADRRRSSRILLEIPVLVVWQDESGQVHSELSTTKVVNAYGALLVLKSPVVVGLELNITNRTTQAKTRARVVWLGAQCADGGLEVGIELGNPDPEFWVGKVPPPERA